MATISANDLEAEARTILRERIERTPWFSYGLSENERLTMIDQEVDKHWPLMTQEAAVRLVNKLAEGSS